MSTVTGVKYHGNDLKGLINYNVVGNNKRERGETGKNNQDGDMLKYNL